MSATTISADRLALARALAFTLGHTFKDVQTWEPGSRTLMDATKVLAYLAADGWSLMQNATSERSS